MNFNIFPFWEMDPLRRPLFKDIYSLPYDRLTRNGFTFLRKLSPLQRSNFSFEYWLLPPRSALKENQKNPLGSLKIITYSL